MVGSNHIRFGLADVWDACGLYHAGGDSVHVRIGPLSDRGFGLFSFYAFTDNLFYGILICVKTFWYRRLLWYAGQ